MQSFCQLGSIITQLSVPDSRLGPSVEPVQGSFLHLRHPIHGAQSSSLVSSSKQNFTIPVDLANLLQNSKEILINPVLSRLRFKHIQLLLGQA